MLYPKFHHTCIKNSVMISGIARSGTTIVGKIVGSFKNFEYVFEPPLISLLNSFLLNSILDKNIVFQIFRTYFAEDKMLNYFIGRGYNMRPSDDSCIFELKTYSDVMNRVMKTGRSKNSIKLMTQLNTRVAFKNPNIYTIIPLLLERISNFKVIDVKRNLFFVLGSTINKKWFSTENLEDENCFTSWPYHDISGNMHIPYFINIEDKNIKSFWNNTNDITRSTYVINELCNLKNDFYRFVKKYSYENCIKIIKYEDLLEKPEEKIKEISIFLNTEYSEMTYQKALQIKNDLNKYDIEKILKNCEESTRNNLIKNNKLLGYE